MLFAYYYTQGHLPGAKRSAKATTQGYDDPIVIRKGGTYSGNWESKDSEVAAVEIRTAEPVVIENSNIRGAGYLIKSWGHAAHITVRNTKGYGLPPTPWILYEKPRRFLIVNNFRHVVVENCYLEQTAGIYIGDTYLGNGSPENTIKIRYNVARNIDGRIHDGWYRAQFVQFNFRNPIQHAEIAWNEVINEPDSSLVEDNINLSNSRGTAASPIRIHNNYIQGAYPIPADSKEYSGGGIIADSWYEDGMGEPKEVATAHVQVYDNQTVNLGNYNYAIAGGNNIKIFNNRAVNAARFKNGKKFRMWTQGLYGYDYYNKNATFDNTFHSNMIGVMGQDGRNDNHYFPDGTVREHNNAFIDGEITIESEKAEYRIWKSKLEKRNILVGPRPTLPAKTPKDSTLMP
ncbi:glycosyl hydrolase [Pontibacter sp. JH31]|uniref:Glycosyl hydrolase n=2 Tax=Pontibacter aquaedesilientis TaxID=2766980 RepID=A0ABR7XDE4_9BACT|nr:glycosyl hydrolase [Pontibacter aquaedesilientis]